MGVWLSDETIRTMLLEVIAFASRSDITVDDAIDLVGLPHGKRVAAIARVFESERRFFLPTPAEIERATAGIRSGLIQVSAKSAARWNDLAGLEERLVAADQYDLAGRIDDDVCDLPPFLYSAGRDA